MNKLPGRFFSHFSKMPNLKHQIFSRHGGVSKGEKASLNVGKNTGDSKDAIMENRRRIHDCLGVENSLYVNQVHGKKILVLKSSSHTPKTIGQLQAKSLRADGMITDIKELALMIQVADCQAVMFHDPEKQIIANVHSGWRGSVQNIIGHCVDLMQTEFGSSPSDIMVGISPSLGPCCAEFIHYKQELTKDFLNYKDRDKDHFNFWDISRSQLLAKGISKKNIEVMGICTKCNHEDFFSHRHSHGTGRFACGIART